MARSIETELEQWDAKSLLRKLRPISSSQKPTLEVGGRRLLNFSSNDYLGLATEPSLVEAAKAALDVYGVGAGASRLICGTQPPHMELEAKLAEFKGTEAALVFSSGYAAAVGVMGALLGKDDVVILDKLCHASLIDGARMSGAVMRIFPHNHLGKLESHLKWARDHFPDGRVLIVTESVFSMDGDWARLPEILEIKQRYGAMLLLDEAHAVGVIGKNGRGLADQLGVAAAVELQMGTLSKALGVSGGYVCASRVLIEYLVNRARSFIYSTAPPAAMAAAAVAALDFLMSPAGERRRQLLRANLIHFDKEMPGFFARGQKIQSAILPVILGDAEVAVQASQLLGKEGFLVPCIRYPTVARDAARLRVTISAIHSHQQISGLCAVLRRIVAQARLS